MTAIPPEELEGRRAQERAYKASRRIIMIDEAVRGIGIAIKVLVREQAELLEEKAALMPPLNCTDIIGHKWMEIADSQERYGMVIDVCPKCGAVKTKEAKHEDGSSEKVEVK